MAKITSGALIVLALGPVSLDTRAFFFLGPMMRGRCVEHLVIPGRTQNRAVKERLLQCHFRVALDHGIDFAGD
jgi:hypothetical protein